MPVSGLVIRLTPAALDAVDDQIAACALQRLRAVAGLSLGPLDGSAAAAVLAADDYGAHDAALEHVLETEGVCAVDVVFHDFSDVTKFDRLPRRHASR